MSLLLKAFLNLSVWILGWVFDFPLRLYFVFFNLGKIGNWGHSGSLDLHVKSFLSAFSNRSLIFIGLDVYFSLHSGPKSFVLTLFLLGDGGGGGLLMPAATLNSWQFQTISDNPSIS